MVFSSIPFLYYFLPCFLILYYALPRQCRNVILVLSSLIFYGWEEPVYILLMLVSIVVSYVLALLIHHFSGTPLSRRFLILGIILHVGSLVFFKYTDLLIASFNTLSGLDLPLREIALPLGISFYTFQILSYLIDVYNGKITVQKNPIHYAAYVSMFPQLVAGPIVRYQDIAASLKSSSVSSGNISYGIRRFIIGLTKKVIIADQLGKLVEICSSTTSPSLLFVWMQAISFTLQIYFDFSGYSDMAIGLGRILGFHFPENFDHPYESKSITEFWRRWHMTLGGWFRDYVYIPLGGNRCKKGRYLFNILLVWGLTGLWHGAAWNFAVWGLYYGLLLLIEKLFLKKYLSYDNKFIGVLSHIYVILATILGFVLFDSNSLADAGNTILSMFGFSRLPLWNQESIYYLLSFGVILLLGILFSTTAPGHLYHWFGKKISNSTIPFRKELGILSEYIKIAVLLGLLILSTAFILDESFHPFLYFRF